MQHRHLNHGGFTLAAIDDIIERGGRSDWSCLRDAAAKDPALFGKILQVCRQHTADPYAQRYHLWSYYATRRVA